MRYFLIATGLAGLIMNSATAQSGVGAWGSLIGNGAGIAEQNVLYSYMSLPEALHGCLQLPQTCGLENSDVRFLRRIESIATAHPITARDRVQFVSEKNRPGFFETGLGQAHRLAKTFSYPGAMTYWNVDQIYDSDGRAALDLPTITAIWIHELGHQAGEPNHQYLDRLGAAVRRQLSQQSLELLYTTPLNPIKIVTINYLGATTKTDLYLSDGQQVMRLSPLLAQIAHCKSPQTQQLLGWKLSNGHWASHMQAIGENYLLPFKAWLEVVCAQNGMVQQTSQAALLQIVLKMEGSQMRIQKVHLELN